MYDYLIVGAGLFGATFARLAADCGKSCLVIDKRSHIGGNCYTERLDDIHIHKYGAHIFHTSNEKVWNFVNRFSTFNSFINSPKSFSNGKLYSLPFNMNTFHELWGVTNPQEAKQIIQDQTLKINPTNLEEQALSLVGTDIYNILIKEYTEKQWGKSATELPAFIIKRLPLRFTFDNNYFNDKYQGIPMYGYTQMISNMLENIEVKLSTNYFLNKEYFNSVSKTIVYTGCIDEFFDYEYGNLEYRSLDFKEEYHLIDNFQGNAVINYCDKKYKHTRIIEHKHFQFNSSPHTIISYEYPQEYQRGMIPYYPINSKYNQIIYEKYKEQSKSLTNFIFGGRLCEYRYMDMDVTIKSAMNKFGGNE